MSWSYSGDPSDSTLDEVRFLIQDADDSEPLISDEELTYLIDKYMPQVDSAYYVGSAACEILAARFAREVTYSADGINIQISQLQQQYKQLAEDLRDQYKTTRIGGPDVGGVLWDEVFDPSIRPLMFATGMHDNYEAGQQDYGGSVTVPPPDVVSQW